MNMKKYKKKIRKNNLQMCEEPFSVSLPAVTVAVSVAANYVSDVTK